MIKTYNYYRGRADLEKIPEHLKQHSYCVGLGSSYNKGNISLFFLIPERPDIIIATSLPRTVKRIGPREKIWPGKLFLRKVKDPVAIPAGFIKFIELGEENINHGLLGMWEKCLSVYVYLTKKDIIRWEKSIYYPTFQPWKDYEMVQVNSSEIQ